MEKEKKTRKWKNKTEMGQGSSEHGISDYTLCYAGFFKLASKNTDVFTHLLSVTFSISETL